jgi:hypothetical protein
MVQASKRREVTGQDLSISERSTGMGKNSSDWEAPSRMLMTSLSTGRARLCGDGWLGQSRRFLAARAGRIGTELESGRRKATRSFTGTARRRPTGWYPI